jgi:hypothetical protein
MSFKLPSNGQWTSKIDHSRRTDTEGVSNIKNEVMRLKITCKAPSSDGSEIDQKRSEVCRIIHDGLGMGARASACLAAGTPDPVKIQDRCLSRAGGCDGETSLTLASYW